jgi:alkylation response protein AidB-like acyl-CoA dehydrogenase
MFELTKQQEMLRKMVREFAEIEIAPKALELDRKGDFPYELANKLAGLGILGLTVSKEFGGSSFGHLAGTIAVEELARVYPSLAFFLEVTQSPMYALEHFGTEEQKRKYLPSLIKGDKFICFAASEPSGGSDLSTLGTEAQSTDDGYVINGRKVYITNGGIADYCLLLAKTGDKASMFLVEKDNPGFIVSRRQDLMGFKTGDVSELAFNECIIPKENLIGKEGEGLGIAMTSFTTSRPAVGAVGLGIARGAFDIALKYSKERILYGKPISRLQAIQFMLVDMDTQIDAAKWLIYYPAALLDQGIPPRQINKFSARAKVVGADVASNVTMQAMQILGGYGVSPEYHLARLLNDAMEIFPATGTSQIMKVIQAGDILR